MNFISFAFLGDLVDKDLQFVPVGVGPPRD